MNSENVMASVQIKIVASSEAVTSKTGSTSFCADSSALKAESNRDVYRGLRMNNNIASPGAGPFSPILDESSKFQYLEIANKNRKRCCLFDSTEFIVLS